MAEYKFDEDSVKALIAWAKSTSFPQSVTLSDAENIVDVKRFVQANLSDIDAHYPDDFYNPAITRLYRLKEYIWKRTNKDLALIMRKTTKRLRNPCCSA